MHITNTSWPMAIPRTPLVDQRLSYEAKGLYATLCASLDPATDRDFAVNVDGAPKKPLQELIDLGYLA